MSDAEKAAAKAFRAAQAAQLRKRAKLIAMMRDDILTLLKEAQDRIALILAGQPSDSQRWQLTQLQNEIAIQMQVFSNSAGAKLSAAAGQAWEAGQELIDAPLQAAASAGGGQIAGIAPLLDTAQLLAMRAFMVERIMDVGAQAASRIKTELGLVVLGQQGQSEAITKITALLGEKSRERAITIARTEIARVYAVAAFEKLQEDAKLVPGLKKQWRRSGKIHSRLSHDLADGQIRDIDKPFNIGGVAMRFPHDPKAPAAETINCGCTLVAWKADWTVATPDRKRFTAQEMQANPMKRDLQEAIDKGESVADLAEKFKNR